MVKKYLLNLFVCFLLSGCLGSKGDSNDIHNIKGGTSTSTGNPATGSPALVLNYDFSDVKALISPRSNTSSIILEKINSNDEIKTAVFISKGDEIIETPEVDIIKKSPDGNYYVVFYNLFRDGDQAECLFYRISPDNQSRCVNSDLRSLRSLQFDKDGNVFYSGEFIDRFNDQEYFYSYRYASQNLKSDIEIISNVFNKDFVSSDGFYFYFGRDLKDTQIFFRSWRVEDNRKNQILEDGIPQDYLVGGFFEDDNGIIRVNFSDDNDRGIFNLILEDQTQSFILKPVLTKKTHPDIDRDCFFDYNGRFVQTSDQMLYYLSFSNYIQPEKNSYHYKIKALILDGEDSRCKVLSSSKTKDYVAFDDKIIYLAEEDGSQKIYNLDLMSGNFLTTEIFSDRDAEIEIVRSDENLSLLMIGPHNRLYFLAIKKSNSKVVLAYIDMENDNKLVISDDEYEEVPSIYYFSF